MENTDRPVTQDEIKRIVRTMLNYDRIAGWISDINGRLTFFDADPIEHKAAYVTIDDMLSSVD